MIEKLLKFLPVVLALAGVVALVGMMTRLKGVTEVQGVAMAERVPGADYAGGTPPPAVAADLTGQFLRGAGEAMAMANPTTPDGIASWPWFRGPNRDGISAEKIPLRKTFSAQSLPKFWQVEVGEGYAGPVVVDGRVYLTDYDQPSKSDVLRCLSFGDGKEIWRRFYPCDVRRNHGMSRTVPAVAKGIVVSFGPKCHVLACDAVTGDYKWGIDMVAQYGTVVPAWYAGQCPLIDGDRVILAPGGKDVLMMAVDIATGKVLWTTPNTPKWDMTHSSIIPMTFNGKKTYVYCASGGVVGVSAETGELLWQTDKWRITMANVPTPIVIDESRVFVCGGYGAGAAMLKLIETDGKIEPQVLWRLKPEAFGSEQQTPIFHNGYLYGVIPSGSLVCLDLDGKTVWSSGSQRFGIGPYMVADGRLYLVNDAAVMLVVEASPGGYKLLGKTTLLPEGHESWGPMALVGGRLVVRDFKRMVCLDLRETPQ